MPFSQSGRYSMNPAFLETLDRAMGLDEEQNDRPSREDGSGERAGRNEGPRIRGKVLRIEIEPAEEGGFVSRLHREKLENGAEEPNAPIKEEAETRAHPHKEHLMQFLERALEQ